MNIHFVRNARRPCSVSADMAKTHAVLKCCFVVMQGQPSAQQLMTAPVAAPPCSWSAALALHACSHLQAASAHRCMQSSRFACVRLPLRLVAAAGVRVTAFTAAVCQYAMSFAC